MSTGSNQPGTESPHFSQQYQLRLSRHHVVPINSCRYRRAILHQLHSWEFLGASHGRLCGDTPSSVQQHMTARLVIHDGELGGAAHNFVRGL